MMGNVDAFLKSLLAFDKDNVPLQCVEKCEKDYLSNPNFNADYIRNKSGAAAGLCGWVVNICKYFRIYQVHCILLVSLMLLPSAGMSDSVMLQPALKRVVSPCTTSSSANTAETAHLVTGHALPYVHPRAWLAIVQAAGALSSPVS